MSKIYDHLLKSCPCCGKPARMKQGAGRYRVQCTWDCVQTVDAFHTPEAAIHFWNNRVEEE